MSERLILPIEARLNLSRLRRRHWPRKCDAFWLRDDLRRPRVRVSAWEATYARRLLERLN